VLDASWTPHPSDPDAPIPVRPFLTSVLDAENLFLASLALLDAWADACGLPERFAKDGVTWWFHARSFVRLDLQELLLWSRIVDMLAPDGRYNTFLVPEDRPLLADAIRVRRSATPPPEIRFTRGSTFGTSDHTGRPVAATTRKRRAGDRPRRGLSLLNRALVALHVRRRPEDRVAALQQRLDELAAHPGSLLSVVRASSFHPVETGGALIHRDPYVGPVVDRVRADGGRNVTLALAMGHRKADHWQTLCDDPTLLPYSILRTLSGQDAAAEADTAALVEERLASIPAVPIRDGARDLGPVITATVRGLGRWLGKQWADMDRAGRLMDTLQPAILLTGWEAARTAWLGAARLRGIRSIAIQHGVIYPDTPDYCRPASPLLVKPDLTCVYGPYDKDILTGQGGYAEATVVASGSPRMHRARLEGPMTAAERASVRSSLGVKAGDRLLVLSGGRMNVGDRLGTLPLLGRVLDGPLPGIHIVVKLHPEERDGAHYRQLLTGQARAGGYAVPAITIVRDIDLYRLLRAADAHLGVLSTVLTDSVLAGTPNMIVVGQAQADLIGYVAAGVAVPVASVDDVRAFMDDPRPPSEDARSRFIDAHYAPGDAADRIAGLILPALGVSGVER
jgi:hypothetical protein